MVRRLTPAFPATAMIAAASVALGTQAEAQSPGVYDVDWTGPYVGLQFGRSIADISGDDGTGSAMGVQAGYRHDFGFFVVGGEVQYDRTDLDVGDGRGTVDSYGRIKVDAGYGIEQWLFYGTFGATRAAAEFTGDDYVEWGWVAGVGADYMVSQRIAVGLEVQHHDFGELGDTGREFHGTTVEAGVTLRF